MATPSNVERLVKAGVLDDSKLTSVGESIINEIELSDEEIHCLVSVKDKLGLGPLILEQPSKSSGVHIWRL